MQQTAAFNEVNVYAELSTTAKLIMTIKTLLLISNCVKQQDESEEPNQTENYLKNTLLIKLPLKYHLLSTIKTEKNVSQRDESVSLL